MTKELEEIFKYKKPDDNKLLAYGFKEENGSFTITKEIMNGQFTLIVTINDDIDYKVIDNDFNEEYVLIKTNSVNNGFIGEVNYEIEQVLNDIRDNCFVSSVLSGPQTRRMIEAIKDKYDADPEFLWDDYGDAAPFRRKDNQKWFALMMTISKKSLIKNSDEKRIEVINLKAPVEMVADLITRKNIYPAYHMNKKHWYTIILDDSIDDKSLLDLIDISYQSVAKKSKKKQ